MPPAFPRSGAGIDHALGADDALGDDLRAVLVLAAVAGHVGAVGVHEVRRAVVVDVAVLLFARTPCGAAAGDDFHGMPAFKPVADIDVVQVLLHNLVAADPHEAVPVALLQFQVAPLRVALPVGEEFVVGEIQHGRSHPVGVHVDDVADLAVLHALVLVEIPGLGAALRARFHRELEFPRFLGGGHEAADAGSVRAHRLLAEDVLLGLHGRLEMHRAVAGIGGEHDDIDIAGAQLLVGIEADEAVLGIHLEAAGELGLQGLGRTDGDLPCGLRRRPPWRRSPRCRSR